MTVRVRVRVRVRVLALLGGGVTAARPTGARWLLLGAPWLLLGAPSPSKRTLEFKFKIVSSSSISLVSASGIPDSGIPDSSGSLHGSVDDVMRFRV